MPDVMKTFAQCLSESAHLRFTGQDFPIIAANPKVAQYLTKLLPALNQALRAGSIANPAYKTLTHNLSRMHNELMTSEIGERFTHSGKVWSLPEPFRSFDFTSGNPGHVAGKLKRLDKIKIEHPIKDRYQEVAGEFLVLVDFVASLKDRVHKRQPKLDEATLYMYVPPMASASAIRTIEEVLTNMSDRLKTEFADYLFKQDVAAVENRITHPITRHERIRGRVPDMLSSLMAKVGENWDSFNRSYNSLKGDYKEIIRKECAEHADHVQKQFLAKNVRKLAKIIELKGNLKGQPTIIHSHAGQGGFSGELRVDFLDGSGFVVRNQVVQKTSQHGRNFLQFPTTFHNARLATGRFMPGQPSEKEMIEDFAGGTAADISPED